MFDEKEIAILCRWANTLRNEMLDTPDDSSLMSALYSGFRLYYLTEYQKMHDWYERLKNKGLTNEEDDELFVKINELLENV